MPYTAARARMVWDPMPRDLYRIAISISMVCGGCQMRTHFGNTMHRCQVKTISIFHVGHYLPESHSRQ